MNAGSRPTESTATGELSCEQLPPEADCPGPAPPKPIPMSPHGPCAGLQERVLGQWGDRQRERAVRGRRDLSGHVRRNRDRPRRAARPRCADRRGKRDLRKRRGPGPFDSSGWPSTCHDEDGLRGRVCVHRHARRGRRDVLPARRHQARPGRVPGSRRECARTLRPQRPRARRRNAQGFAPRNHPREAGPAALERVRRAGSRGDTDQAQFGRPRVTDFPD